MDAKLRLHAVVSAGAAAILLWLLSVFAGSAFAKTFSPWGEPLNAEAVPGTSAELNTISLEGCPIPSPDGLVLYFASNRPGGFEGLDIWSAHRESKDDPWGPPSNLGPPVNSSADDFCPTPVPGHGLFFVSSRPGGCGGPDIYFTRRNRKGGYLPPQNLGCQVNSDRGEAGPSLVEQDDDAILYFSSARPGGFSPEGGPPFDSDIYMSVMEDKGDFGPATLVPTLNTSGDDSRPNVRKDGLEIFFDRSAVIGGAADIYSATRKKISAPWSTPFNLGSPVNTADNESRASLSRDGRTLYFGSNRVGTEGSSDIYFTTREKVAASDDD